MSLDEVSRKRKEEMDAVRAKYMKPAAAASASGATRLKFRSYRPSSDILKEKALPAATAADLSLHLPAPLADAEFKAPGAGAVDLADLAPRKPDWDLKRALAPKLRKLERRTERAIADIVRERLQREIAEAEYSQVAGEEENQEAMHTSTADG